MEQVRMSLDELEEKASEVKKVLINKYMKIKLDRTKADIRKMQQQHETDNAIADARASLDKEREQDLSEFAKQIHKEQLALLKKALCDQRALFARTIEQERAIANEVLQNSQKKNEENIMKLQETIDSFNDHARAQVQELDNHCFNLKLQMNKSIPLIQQQLSDNMNVEDPDDMISMPRWFFNRVVDNYCGPHLAMKFKVFKIGELYPDLEKYDLRSSLGEFGIVGTSVKFHKFMRALRYQGYMFDAEVYYLNPAPGSVPSTDLVRIVGAADVQQMVCAHAEHRTKICLLYLVSRYEYQDPDDVMIESSESDEEADKISSASLEPNTTVGITQSGDEGQQPGGGDNHSG